MSKSCGASCMRAAHGRIDMLFLSPFDLNGDAFCLLGYRGRNRWVVSHQTSMLTFWEARGVAGPACISDITSGLHVLGGEGLGIASAGFVCLLRSRCI
jgi:hypothetical protein